MPSIITRRSHAISLTLGLTLLAACGQGSDTTADATGGSSGAAERDRPAAATTSAPSSSQPSQAQASLLEGLGAGSSHLQLEGAATSDGSYTTREDARYTGILDDRYRPAQLARRGSNQDGPFEIGIFKDAVHEDDPQNTVRVAAVLVLPEGAQAGQTYTVGEFRGGGDDQVLARIQGDGQAWTFGRQVQGTVWLEQLDDVISAAWEFSAADGTRDDARRVEAVGAVRELPITRQTEAEYTLTVNGEDTTNFQRVMGRAQNERQMLVIGDGIYLYVPMSASSGTYPIQASRGAAAEAVGAQFTRQSVSQVQGELILEANGDYWDAVFSIEAEGDDTVRLQGELRQVAAQP